MTPKKPELPVVNEPMSDEESFHQCFLNFMDSLDVLSLDAAEQCELMDNFNVAREIQQDVYDSGISLVNWPVIAVSLSPCERVAIAHLIRPLMALPEAALLRHEHMQAMSHPAWADFRITAKRLCVLLDDAVKKSRAFYNGQW